MSDIDEKNDLNAELPKKPGVNAGKKVPRIPTSVKIVAKVLTESGMTLEQTGRELGLAKQTVQRAIADPNLDREIIETAKLQLPVKMLNVAMKIADRLSEHPEHIAKMTPYMQALVLAIFIDKARLMQGQSTENLEVKGKILEIQTGLDKIKEMRQQLSTHPTPEPKSDHD